VKLSPDEKEEEEGLPFAEADGGKVRVDDALTRAAEAEVASPYRAPSPMVVAAPKKAKPPSLEDAAYTIRAKSTHVAFILLGVLVGGTLGAISAGIAVLPLLAFVFWSRRRATRYVVQLNEASQALMAGEVDAPARVYDSVMSGVKGRPGLHSVAVLNRACCFQRSGEHERAARLLAHVHESGWLESEATLSGHAASVAASCEGLRGALETARDWLAIAKQKVAPSKAGLLVFPELILAARTEDYAGAMNIADTRWSEAETVGGAAGMRSLRVIAAFARSKSGRLSESEIETQLAAVRPFRPGELDYLAVSWPELRTFMQKHDLLTD